LATAYNQMMVCFMIKDKELVVNVVQV